MSLIVGINLDAFVFVVTGITEPEDKTNINHAFEEIVESNYLVRDKSTGAAEFASGGYSRSTKVQIPNHTEGAEVKYLRLYINPFDSANSYVKMALHKHPYRPEDYRFAESILTQLLQNCQADLLGPQNIKVKRVDIAIDIKSSITNFWFDKKRTQVAMNAYGKSGKIETVYLGTNRSDNRVRVYDKAAQKKSKRHKYHKKHELVRIEFCIKPECTIDVLFTEIDLPSRLGKFSIYKSKAIKKAAIFSDEICSLIDYVGIKSVLQSMDQSKRRKALKQMEHFRRKVVSKRLLEKRLAELSNDLKLLYVKGK